MDGITEKSVSFLTNDGVNINGEFALPHGVPERPPVVILVRPVVRAGSGDDVQTYSELAQAIAGYGVATLSFDLRRAGGGELDLRSSNNDGLSDRFLDVQAALAFLDSQSVVDSSRVGIVAGEQGADAAVKGWSGNTQVRAMTLVSGRLSAAAKQEIAASPKLPLRLFVSGEDKAGFADMTDAYFLSRSKETDIQIYNGLGTGAALLRAFLVKYPKEKPLVRTIGDWMAHQVLSTGRLREVSFQTEDGWTIYGNFRVPENVTGELPVVILLHTSQSDRYAYSELEVALSKAGLAVLNFDWRGRGKSIGKGRYADLSDEERKSGYRDVLAAVNFLTSQSAVNPARIGILGAAMGTMHAMGAAVREPRIRTAVVLTGYFPSEEEKTYFSQGDRPILFIATRGMTPALDAMTVIYEMTKDKGSELVIYDGGAVGYQLFEQDEHLIARIVAWMENRLKQ